MTSMLESMTALDTLPRSSFPMTDLSDLPTTMVSHLNLSATSTTTFSGLPVSMIEWAWTPSALALAVAASIISLTAGSGFSGSIWSSLTTVRMYRGSE
jgi:hypothetical protein